MEVSRPNELETPNLEAKTGETDINTDIELIEVTCSPRGRVVERNPIGVRTKWLINGREVSMRPLNGIIQLRIWIFCRLVSLTRYL